MIDLVLFPSSYFSIKKVDEDLQNEYDAVKETGLFDTVLFGYDKFVVTVQKVRTHMCKLYVGACS